MNNQAGTVWFDNGRYIGSLPPGAFKDGERLTQQKIRDRIKQKGFTDPLWDPSPPQSAVVTGTAGWTPTWTHTWTGGWNK